MAREIEEADDPKPPEFKLTKKQAARMKQIGTMRQGVNDTMLQAMNACFEAFAHVRKVELEAWDEILDGDQQGWNWAVRQNAKGALIAKPLHRIEL